MVSVVETKHEKYRRSGNDGTFVEITTVQLCHKPPLLPEFCAPKFKESAIIHLGPEPARRIAEGTAAAIAAISGALTSTGVGAPIGIWTMLVAALVGIGYAALKNNDDSIDMFLDNVRVRVGPAGGMILHADPLTCTAALQAL